MNALRLTLAASLMLATAAQASAACNIRTISGTYEVQVTRIDHNELSTAYTTCWLEVSRNSRDLGNLRIACNDGDPLYYGYFGIYEVYEQAPWHQLQRVRGRTGIPQVVRQVEPCRWQIVDRNGNEGIDYNVTFSSDGQSLVGVTPNVYHWLSRNNLTFVLNGVRQ